MLWMQALPPGLSRRLMEAKYVGQYSRPTASTISMEQMASYGPSLMSR